MGVDVSAAPDPLRRESAPRRGRDLRFRELDASRAGLAALGRFYRERYVAQFPDADERESLANIRRYLALKAQGGYGSNNYHVVIAEQHGDAVGGVVLDYLAAPDAGVIEFLFVDAAHRGNGIGRALLDETIRLLRADATASGRPLRAVVAEMNDPYRRPATPDNLDPFCRARIWGRWGFHVLGFPYVQPALSAAQKPVDNLLLIARMFGRVSKTGASAAWVRLIVAEYLRWAMRIPEPAADRDFRTMAEFLGARRLVPLRPLQHYVGHDPQREFVVDAIASPAEPAFDRAIALARAGIPAAGRVAAPEDFAVALAGRAAYHLWALRTPRSQAIEGMASFFTLPTAGFGGYIVLAGALRGRGLLALLIARIEAAMMADGTRAEGWFIECGDDTAPTFLRHGFAEVPFEYRPPPVGEDTVVRGPPERLRLLYKRFGLAAAPRLARKALLDALREILRVVYGVAAPHAHRCYRLAKRTLAGPENADVALSTPG